MGRDAIHETYTVAGGVRAPRAVRNLVRPQIEPYLDADALYDVELLVAEVINNAVRHGGADEQSTLGIDLRVDANGIRFEVADPGSGFTRPKRPKPRPTGGGNGLVLLERIAASWGVVRADRTRVWFAYTPPPAR